MLMQGHDRVRAIPHLRKVNQRAREGGGKERGGEEGTKSINRQGRGRGRGIKIKKKKNPQAPTSIIFYLRPLKP